MDKEEFDPRVKLKSAIKYVTDPKAQNIWKFLQPYLYWDNNDKVSIPAIRVLDALSMINQDKIEYSTV